MRPRWQRGGKAAARYDICDYPSVNLKIETGIPSEVRRPIDSEDARREVIVRPEVPGGTSLRNSTDKGYAPENQDHKDVCGDEF